MTSPAARGLVGLVRAYQHLRANRLSPCRFYPSCSEYAREAIESHGAIRGGGLALRRIGRCRPLGGHGYDPVPEASIDVPVRSDHGEIPCKS